MRLKTFFVVFIASFWTCVQANPVQSEQECGQRDVASGPIRGGSISRVNAWPWQVVFGHDIAGNRDFFCGGSLVSAQHVVSAASCFQNKWQKNITSPRDFLAFVGKHNLKVEDEIGSAVHKVWGVIVHQDWKINDTRWDADISLIVLMSEVDLSDFRFVGIVCLPPSSDHEVTGRGTISGWGLSEESQKTFSSTPNELRLPIVNQSVCEDADDKFSIVSSNRTFCAGYVNQNKAVCQGDSGSGFFQIKKRKYNLAGVVSVSLLDYSAYCVTDSYSLFTDVSKFTDWIKDKIDETKKIKMDEVDFECERNKDDMFKCEHKFIRPMKRNLKMKTDYEKASSTREVWIDFGTSEFIFSGIAESFANLKTLWIDNGRIKFIEKENFIGLEKLEKLDLAKNKIEFLPDDVFSDLPSLTKLNLYVNRIQELPERVFWNLTSLTSLSLPNNWIKELPERVFWNLSSLTMLDLDSNQIKELPERVFWNLSSLTKLGLSQNQIKELPERVFWNLTSLTTLDLGHNQIKELPERVFWNSTSLTSLNLFHNQIEEFPENLLNNLTKLRYLWFNDNLIEFFPSKLFSNKPELEYIYIYNNKITTIDFDFSSHPNLAFYNVSRHYV